MPQFRYDLHGETFGELRVTQYAGNKNKHAYWKCQCSCGNRVTVRGEYLREGKITSCGCKDPRPIRRRPHDRSGAESLTALTYGEMTYLNLANAIVAVAADDYRRALRTEDIQYAVELERFFFSPWFMFLTDLDPQALIDRLRREFRENLLKNNFKPSNTKKANITAQ